MTHSSKLAQRALTLSLSALITACASQPIAPAQQHTAAAIEVPPIKRPEGETPQWWFRNGAAQAANVSAQASIQGQRAKNVIVFLGDGMSTATIAASLYRFHGDTGGIHDRGLPDRDLLQELHVIERLAAAERHAVARHSAG